MRWRKNQQEKVVQIEGKARRWKEVCAKEFHHQCWLCFVWISVIFKFLRPRKIISNVNNVYLPCICSWDNSRLWITVVVDLHRTRWTYLWWVFTFYFNVPGFLFLNETPTCIFIGNHFSLKSSTFRQIINSTLSECTFDLGRVLRGFPAIPKCTRRQRAATNVCFALNRIKMHRE